MGFSSSERTYLMTQRNKSVQQEAAARRAMPAAELQRYINHFKRKSSKYFVYHTCCFVDTVLVKPKLV
jgi:hypothetical protein